MVYTTLLITGFMFAFLERLPQCRFQKAALFRRCFATDVFYFLTGFIAGTSLTYSFILAASAALGSIGLPRLSAFSIPIWASILIGLVAIDFGNYAAHLLMHRYNVLRQIHKVHHSSRALDWLATFRSHILEQTLRRLLAPLVLVFIGLPLEAITVAAAVFSAWGMFIHCNLDVNLRPLE